MSRLVLDRCTKAAAATLLIALAATAFAQDSPDDASAQSSSDGASARIEEIIVTAAKRESSIVDLPMGVTALTEQTLRDMGAADVSGYIRTLTAVAWESSGPASSEISIRGVNTFFGDNAATGYYLDETPITGGTWNAQFGTFDVDRVELLRGPQGTLYGEGSMGGTMRVITNKPDSARFASAVEGTFSSSDGATNYLLNGMVNVPLVEDAFAVRAVIQVRDDGGYIDNIFLDDDGVNGYELQSGRVSMRWEASLDWTVTGTFMTYSGESGDGVNDANDRYQTASSVNEAFEDGYDLFNLQFDYSGTHMDFMSSTSLFERELYQVTQVDHLVNLLNGAFGFLPFPLPYLPIMGVFSENEFQQDILTHEMRLVSTHGGPVQWTAGLFYKDSERGSGGPGNVLGNDAMPLPTAQIGMTGAIFGNPEADAFFQDTTSTTFEQSAVFGEVSYDLSHQWQLLLGVRYFTEDRKTTSVQGGLFNTMLFFFNTGGPPPPGLFDTPFEQSNSENVLIPKATLTFEPLNDLLFYTTYTHGFRSGGDNVFAGLMQTFTGVPVPVSYDAESLRSYEFGWKSVFADNRVQFTGAFFYNDWQDMQLGLDQVIAFNAVANLFSAHTAGFEADFMIAATPRLTINLRGSVIEAEADEDVTTGSFAGLTKGTKLPSVPELSYYGAIQYVRPIAAGLSAMFRADYTYQGENRRNLSDTTNHPAQKLANIRFGVEAENWQAFAFAENIGNNLASQLLIDAAANAAAFPPHLVAPNDRYYLNRPRTYGVTLSAQF